MLSVNHQNIVLLRHCLPLVIWDFGDFNNNLQIIYKGSCQQVTFQHRYILMRI